MRDDPNGVWHRFCGTDNMDDRSIVGWTIVASMVRHLPVLTRISGRTWLQGMTWSLDREAFVRWVDLEPDVLGVRAVCLDEKIETNGWLMIRYTHLLRARYLEIALVIGVASDDEYGIQQTVICE